MAYDQEDRSQENIRPGSIKGNALLDFLGCSYRATVRLIKGLPSRTVNSVKRKIKEYRNRPKRTDISRVYVVVGYTTKKRVDEKFNAERRMMILRRGLLLLIFLMILVIAFDRFTGLINYGEMAQIFGIESWDEVVENDPFADKTDETSESAYITLADIVESH
ncbi:MAG: hypothetical protein IKG03_06230 [Clostridiales bacterium]|nr:hypothetical protein [Clostridiales bacterium]